MKNMTNIYIYEEYNICLKNPGWIKKMKSTDMTFHDMYSK